MKKYLSLESIRGVAAIIVALFHSEFVVNEQYPVIAQGAIFVDLFFVLSGFVMFFAYGEKIGKGLSFTKYILMRFGRLYPLHLAILIVWVLYVFAKGYIYTKWNIGTDPFEKNNLYSFATNLLLVHSMGFHESHNWNYPSWSISVEFFSYIVFFLVVSKLGGLWRHHYFLFLSLLSYSALWLLSADSLERTIDFGFLRCLGGFFLGSWVSRVINNVQWEPSYLMATAYEVCAVGISLFLVVNSAGDKFFQLLAFISFGAVVAVFAVQNRGFLSKFLEHDLLVMFGTLSYSIYMIHAIIFAGAGRVYCHIMGGEVRLISRDGAEPIKALVTPYADIINIGCLAAIIILASFTYKYIESPARTRFRRYADTI